MNANTIHFKLYEEILCGKYRPYLVDLTNKESIDKFIADAHTTVIQITDNSDKSINSLLYADYCYLGYKSKSDYEIRLVEKANKRKEIHIVPLKTYKLMETMDLPQFNTVKCNGYLEFMSDEFERIKLRAEQLLEKAETDNIISSYATKHFHKSKKLFHDSKQYLMEITDKSNPDDVYIILTLNMFIVRTILFYQTFFRSYIPSLSKVETGTQLMSEVVNSITLKKICNLFRNGNICNNDYTKKSRTEKYDVSEGTCSESQLNQTETKSSKKSQYYQQGLEGNSKIKINGQINVFVDVFLQMLEEVEVDGKPFIETSYETLETIILNNFIDKNGKDLSRATIHTFLKPYRTDKRLKPGSPKRISVLKAYKKKK